MKTHWSVWSAAFPPQWCDLVIERAMTLPAHRGTIGFDNQQAVDQDYRSATIRWLEPDGADNHISRHLMRYVERANRDNFGFDLMGLFDLQFTEYRATEGGRYDWHHDVDFFSQSGYERKLSLVVQLSEPDDYEGGDFEFFGLPQPGEAFRARGSLLVFPSFYPHRVAPVTRGIRRSMVSWIDGPRWR